MESSGLQELEQIPGVGIVLTVEFSRSLAGNNLYNNLLQSHTTLRSSASLRSTSSRQFFTLKGIKLLPGILTELQGQRITNCSRAGKSKQQLNC